MLSLRTFFLAAALALMPAITFAADPAPVLTAAELANRLSALRQDGSSFVRLRMEIKGGASGGEVLQLQIKQRRTKASADVLYQVLFPKERKGESVLLRKSGNRAGSGTVFTPTNNKVRALDDLKEPLFGSDLTCEDVVDDFFSWDQQTIVGTETVDGAACQILESKPGKGERSSYGSVKSWIDSRRIVPLRVEKYSGSGKLVRRIDTTRVVSDAGHPIPANLSVRGPRADSVTELDGSKISHDVTYTDKDFSSEAVKTLTGARE
jgi:hypothetical protein